MNAHRLALVSLVFLCLGAGDVFTLQSPAFADGDVISRIHAGNDKTTPSCTGDNVSPPLQWSNAPPATKSFILLIYDQQGRAGLGVSHQVAYGIPATTSGFAQGALETETGFVGGKGSPGKTTYYGPCPPAGTGLHHYVFTLIATDFDPAALEPGLTQGQVLDRLKGHALGSAGIIARFGQ